MVGGAHALAARAALAGLCLHAGRGVLAAVAVRGALAGAARLAGLGVAAALLKCPLGKHSWIAAGGEDRARGACPGAVAAMGWGASCAACGRAAAVCAQTQQHRARSPGHPLQQPSSSSFRPCRQSGGRGRQAGGPGFFQLMPAGVPTGPHASHAVAAHRQALGGPKESQVPFAAFRPRTL